MAMSLITDDEDYENSDAEQVVTLSQTLDWSLDLRKGDGKGCMQLLFVCICMCNWSTRDEGTVRAVRKVYGDRW